MTNTIFISDLELVKNEATYEVFLNGKPVCEIMRLVANRKFYILPSTAVQEVKPISGNDFYTLKATKAAIVRRLNS